MWPSQAGERVVVVVPTLEAVTLPRLSSGQKLQDWLTADRMAAWVKENKVIKIVLRDNLHQPQYVEKLEKMIRFVIKEKALSLSDLDDIWSAQDGKHETIVKNVHDLLAKPRPSSWTTCSSVSRTVGAAPWRGSGRSCWS